VQATPLEPRADFFVTENPALPKIRESLLHLGEKPGFVVDQACNGFGNQRRAITAALLREAVQPDLQIVGQRNLHGPSVGTRNWRVHGIFGHFAAASRLRASREHGAIESKLRIPFRMAPSDNSNRPSAALRRFAWGVLAYNVAVIVWGAAVRATGSGNGCGEHWPLCEGTVVLQHPTIAAMIELAHRATSGIDVLCVVALAVWTFRAVPKRHLARAWAVAVLVLTFNEALIGALLVELGLTANNASPARAFYLGLHLTNTLLLLAALTLTAHFLSRRSGAMRGSCAVRAPGLALTGLIAVLLVGVTGSLAALGDTLYPAHDLWRAVARDFAPGSSWLLRVRWLHPVCALVAGVFIVWLAARALMRGADQRLATGVVALLAAQYAVGLVDLALLTPTALQMLHLLVGDLLWIALVVLCARMCLVPQAASVAAERAAA